MKLTDFEGKEIEILEIEIIKYQKEQKVYNFSVEGTRNYYVGEERLLNHNLDDCIGRNNIAQNTEIKNTQLKNLEKDSIIEFFDAELGEKGSWGDFHKKGSSTQTEKDFF